MQAITTKFLCATNFRGSRVKAVCQAGSIILGWDHALNHEGNHTAAAKALARKLEWHGMWIGGFDHDQNGVFVCWVGPEHKGLEFKIDPRKAA